MRQNTTYIVTIYDVNPNYGNRLQNYAVQELLKCYGEASVKTIAYRSSGKVVKCWIKGVIHKLTNYRFSKSPEFYKYGWKRTKLFQQFNKDYISVKLVRNLRACNDGSCYVLGSDQVWNPAWYHESKLKKHLFLLDFIGDNEKKICLAPSFGTEELNPKWEDWFRERLNRMGPISVREQSGAEIVQKLIGKEATVLIDPTMMLDSAEWLKIAKKPKSMDTSNNCIVTYFISPPCDQARDDTDRIQQELYGERFEIGNIKDQNAYLSDPCNFIYVIANAKVVLTDSFHACVFSFLFGKPFLVYERTEGGDTMMTRICNFLEKFGLERKYAASGMANELLEHDYSYGYEILGQEREKFQNYLEKELHRVHIANKDK